MERLIDSLRRLGLTEYEARAYVSLAELGPSSPRDVARRARIPYPSAYDALKMLVSKGWAEKASSEPAMYGPRPPETIGKEAIANLRGAFSQLEKIYRNVPSKSERLELIYTVIGRDNILRKIFEMLDRARKSVTLVVPWDTDTSRQIAHLLRNLKARNVDIRLMTDSVKAASFTRKARFRKPVLAVDLLVDESEALIGLADYSACGWVHNPLVAAHFKEFLTLMWKDSKPLQASPS